MQTKITPAQESRICLSCGECCRRYWITVLPTEAKKIAKKTKKPLARFLREDCMLLVKLYPKSVKGILTFPSVFFPKSVIDTIRTDGGVVSESYFVVPQVVLKRVGSEARACTFLGEGNTCSIYKERPEPCRLFPFIAVEGFRESYPFCELFRVTQKDYSKRSDAYFKKVKKYFDTVDKRGMERVWKELPSTGVLYAQEKRIGTITKTDLLKLMQVK